VKVNIEAKKNVDDMDALKNGLIKLNKSDPSVQFFVNKKGEFILSTCGEVHLERCIKDLNDDFCPGVELTVSEPIIEFRETIINRKLTNKIYKNKLDNYEERLSDSSDGDEESKARDEMCVQELLQYEEKLAKMNE
jgi:ribosome assembly protein 1